MYIKWFGLEPKKQRSITSLDRIRFFKMFCKLSLINPKCLKSKNYMNVKINVSNVVVLRGRPFDFWGLARKFLSKKKTLHWKKFLSWRIILEKKNITLLYVRKIASGLGKKFLPKPINLRSGPILAVLIHSQPDLRLTQTKSHIYPSQ